MMAVLAATVLALIAQAQAVEPIRLTRGSSVTTELTASEVQQATLQLRHGVLTMQLGRRTGLGAGGRDVL